MSPRKKRKVNLVIDSGAFSCWRRQEELPLADYIAFVHEHQEHILAAVNLDVIPGEFGRVPSPREVEASAKKGHKNLNRMRKEGIEAMPVFHQGERRYWLERMIGEGHEWIGISPANDRTTSQKIEWLDEIFTFLCGREGYPKIKTHGFGVTALPIMFRYPWYSVDSATWVMIASYGGIFVPRIVNGQYDYSVSPNVIQVSDTREGRRPSSLSIKHGRHLGNMGPEERRFVIDYVGQFGFSLDGMATEFKYRCQATARFWMELMKVYRSPRFVRPREGFFSASANGDMMEGLTETPWPGIRIIFTVPTSGQHSWALTSQKVWDRLISFYYFKDGKTKSWNMASYVRTGLVMKKRHRL